MESDYTIIKLSQSATNECESAYGQFVSFRYYFSVNITTQNT